MGAVPQGFEYRVDNDGSVQITHHGRAAGTLRGATASRFLEKAETGDAQLLMARATGNYRHGNERAARSHPRSQGGR